MPTKRKVKKASLGKQKGEKLVINNLKFKPRAENRKTSIRSALYFTKMSDLASIINPRGKAPPVKRTAGNVNKQRNQIENEQQVNEIAELRKFNYTILESGLLCPIENNCYNSCAAKKTWSEPESECQSPLLSPLKFPLKSSNLSDQITKKKRSKHIFQDTVLRYRYRWVTERERQVFHIPTGLTPTQCVAVEQFAHLVRTMSYSNSLTVKLRDEQNSAKSKVVYQYKTRNKKPVECLFDKGAVVRLNRLKF